MTRWSPSSALRQLRTEPGAAALVIAGLALGLALTLLTVAFLRDTLWPDGALPDRLVTFEWQTRTPGGGRSDWRPHVPAASLDRALRDTGAPVEAIGRLFEQRLPARATNAHGAPHRASLALALADDDLLTLLDLRAVAGDLRAALASPEGIALTEAGAHKLFGRADVVGRPFTVTVDAPGEGGAKGSMDLTLTVMAVLPSRGANATLQFDALAGFSAPAAKAFVDALDGWMRGNGRLYALLKPGATAEQLTQLAQRLLEQQPVPAGLPADFLKGGGAWAYLRALPVADIGLHGAGSAPRRLQLGSLAAAAGGVLALAVINFINLWSVRTLRRQREIGLRKSLGAGGAALGRQFFGEALVVAGLASVIGLLLAWWSAPAVSLLMKHTFDVPVVSPVTVALAAGLCVAIAALSALPLTAIALRVRTAESLAGRSHSEGAAGRWLRRLMTTVQFAAAAVFTAMAATVTWQTEHAGRMPRGFEVDDRLAVDLPRGARPEQVQSLLAQIRTWPDVVAAAASPDVPGRDNSLWFSEFRGAAGQAASLRTGVDFTPGWLDVYGMRLVAGRLSADHRAELAQHGVVLDRRAAQALGFASPESAIGQTLGVNASYADGQPVTVVAVIEDIRMEGPRRAPLPHLMTPVVERAGGVISVHSRAVADTRRKLVALLAERLPDARAQVLTVREQQARTVADDVRIGQLVAITGAMALLLAAVGIYALAAYTLRRREREIVLRKLHGAGAGSVARLLGREFAGVLGAACVVALPLAAWVTQRYLSDFVERAPVGPFSVWVLLASVAALAAVMALAVARHLRAALALRPLHALRG